ncbi:Mpp10 protein-domain-containing protein [Cantharellus anzutake]|uniref:Mpp10 protein-domain-containing protein n=1 Tax=Cantharellus anzutake TaxID=1750568 RepID=UPI0019041764|nr:Mpp10 protein-domain-containing protein [Cantharellus anzutake]KAF8329792.1 Mpp10 protein-domain-containing protein [Cantharellus anzutake]
MATSQETAEHYDELKPLVAILAEKPEVLATGNLDTQDAALRATKFLFDLAISTEAIAAKHIATLNLEPPSSGPTTRSKSKVQDGHVEVPKSVEPVSTVLDRTSIDQLYIVGMNADQIWEQLELRTKNLAKVLDEVVQIDDPDQEPGPELGVEDEDEDESDDDEDEDWLPSDEMEVDGFGEEASGLGENLEDEDGEDSGSEDDDLETAGLNEESIMKIRRGSDEEDEIPDLDLDRPGTKRSSEMRPRHPTLDDDFFSIDDFNMQSEAMESLFRSRGQLAGDDEDDEDEDEDEIDLFQKFDDPGNNEIFDEEDEEKGGFVDRFAHITYADFFVPPRSTKKRGSGDAPSEGTKKKSARGVKFSEDVRVKTIEARKGKSAKASALFARLESLGGLVEELESEEGEGEEMDWDMEEFGDEGEDEEIYNDFGEGEEGEEEEEEGEGGSEDDGEDDYDDYGEEEEEDHADETERQTETIQRLKSDLFDDGEEKEVDPAERLSMHEKRMTDLSSQIAALEAENVAEKDWQLMGEATARSRPKNSLLEETLDFEHNAIGGRGGAPEITEERTRSLEDLIKDRILEGRFDDVARKRPVDDKPFLPSKYFELQDKQSSRSLAQIYEDEYKAARGDNLAPEDDRDGKLAKEREAIDEMWSTICYKLDALSNAHFTPKQPKGTIETISNVSSVTMESALPAAMSATSLLAPQEIHKPLPESEMRSREELTPQEKRTVHRKILRKKKHQKEKFAGALADLGKRPKNIKEAKEVALDGLVKQGRGVTVIGKEKVGKVSKRERGDQSLSSTDLKL